jgi:hypothetical protein
MTPPFDLKYQANVQDGFMLCDTELDHVPCGFQKLRASEVALLTVSRLRRRRAYSQSWNPSLGCTDDV